MWGWMVYTLCPIYACRCYFCIGTYFMEMSFHCLGLIVELKTNANIIWWLFVAVPKFLILYGSSTALSSAIQHSVSSSGTKWSLFIHLGGIKMDWYVTHCPLTICPSHVYEIVYVGVLVLFLEYIVCAILFHYYKDLHVGITSATITTSPYYALDICVCVTSGVLQSGITLSVSLTAAVQGQGLLIICYIKTCLFLCSAYTVDST